MDLDEQEHPTRQYLTRWLLDNGYAEPRAGFGHVSAEQLADALLGNFTLTMRGDHLSR